MNNLYNYKSNKLQKEMLSNRITFQIQILYRSNTSWQGEILWLEGCETLKFRSLFEMIHLMETAMENENRPNSRYFLRSWSNKNYRGEKPGKDEV